MIGTAVIIAANISAGSVALAGFGLDSLIEIVASTIVVWQLKGVSNDLAHVWPLPRTRIIPNGTYFLNWTQAEPVTQPAS